MLLKLRGGLDSFLVTILLGLLIGAFALWGIGPNMLSSANQSIASVGDTEISTNRYYSQVQSRAQAMQAQFGGQLSTPDIIRLMRLDDQILQQLLIDAAIEEHISTLGMRASDALVRKELETIEGFLLPDGSLSKEMIQQALISNGLSEEDFLNDVRNGVSRRQLLQSMLPENALPKYFAEKLYTWEAERRRATMINIPADAVKDLPEPTEEEIAELYENTKAGYMTPERRSYSYILVSPALFADTIDVSEEDIQAAYDARLSEYQQPEKRDLQQVSFTDEAVAKAFITEVEGGADFAEAGAAVTDFTADEINLGVFTKTDIENTYDTATADAVFALDDGGITAPLSAFSGFNVFKNTATTVAVTRTLDDVRPEIEKAYKEEEAIELMYDFLPELEEAVADEADLVAIAANENVAAKIALSVATVSDVTSRGLSLLGASAVTSQEEATIMQHAFRSTTEEDLQLTDIDPNDAAKGVYLIKVSTIAETAQQPLEDVRTDVAAAWTANERQAKAGDLAETAKTRLAAGDDPELIAVELGGTSFDAKNVVRTAGVNSSLANNIRQLIFDTANGGIDLEKAADGNGYIVVRVDEVTPGDVAANTAAVVKRLTELNTQMSQDIYAQYQAYLQSSYPPVVNRALQKQLFSENSQQQ
ncbi:MAG: SurA N-terminal domain-containing protein [Kordiimonadaceae bacterium]|nr:SurA N-terminal domain-containing protein [Kordiimonadaceae bacterium]